VKKAPPGKRRPVADDEPRRIAAKPRKRTEGNDYDYGDMGNLGGSRGGRGNKLLNPEANRVQIWRPTWDKNIPTTVRILPALDYEDTTKLVGYRRSTGHSKFSHWCFGCPGVQYVGIDTKFTFLLYHPAWQRSRSYDPATNPYQILFDEFKMAIKNEEARYGKKDLLTKKWFGLAHDSKNPKRRAFSTVKSQNFYKVFIYAHKDKYLLDPKTGLPFGANKRDPTILLCVTKTAGESLAAKLNRKVPGVSEDAKISQLFEFGDITLLKGGKFVTFLGPDHVNSLDFSRYGVKVTDDSEGPNLEEEGDDDEAEEGGGGDDAFNTRWRTHIHREFTYVTKAKKRRTIDADISNLRDVVISRHEWWEDVLQFPSHEPICVWLATAFRSMPDIIRYGWRDNREFMTDEVKGILAARTQGPGAEVPEDEDADDVEDGSEVDDGSEVEEEEDDRPRRKKETTSRRASSVADDEEGEDEDEVEDGSEVEDEEDDVNDSEEEAEDETEEEAEEDEPVEDERPRGKKPVNRVDGSAPKLKKKLKKKRPEPAEYDEEEEVRAMTSRAQADARARSAHRNGAPVILKKKKKKLRL
jgi:hypothetical protein